MTNEDKLKLMNQAAKPLVDLLEKRLKNKETARTALSTNSFESLSDEVKKLRELQTMRLNAVIEELTDLVDIAKAMYP